MWINSPNGRVKISKACAFLFEQVYSGNDKYFYGVFANFESGARFLLKKLDTVDEAEKYIADLVEKLNGEKIYVDKKNERRVAERDEYFKSLYD